MTNRVDLANFALEAIPSSRNKYCGPAAAAAITGQHPDHCAGLIADHINLKGGLRVVRSGDGVKGTYPSEVNAALKHFGLRMYCCDALPEEGESFKKWAVRTEAERGDAVYLVSAGRHWRVVHKWQTVCGIRRTPHHTNSAVKPGSKVKDVWKILPL